MTTQAPGAKVLGAFSCVGYAARLDQQHDDTIPMKAILHMKIDPKVKEDLRRKAEQENRNLSNLIETILRQALQSGK